MSPLSSPPPVGDQPTIPAGELTLRPWRPEDAAQLVKALRDPEIRAWNGQALQNEQEAQRWIARRHEKWLARTAAGWAIAFTADPETLVGQVALRDLYR